MATIKSYTDLSQSKKLAEILPLESADMCYEYQKDRWIGEPEYLNYPQFQTAIDKRDIPCWSLSALMNYLREIGYFPKIRADEHEIVMSIDYQDEDEDEIYTINIYAESFVDACYEMIIKLNELNLL